MDKTRNNSNVQFSMTEVESDEQMNNYPEINARVNKLSTSTEEIKSNFTKLKQDVNLCKKTVKDIYRGTEQLQEKSMNLEAEVKRLRIQNKMLQREKQKNLEKLMEKFKEKSCAATEADTPINVDK